ncbi:Putative uncharacterized protein [Pararhodospirillum photometricum DSM 122]|uniref:Translocation and assembly module TamB C-terminal domain-containing protein n=1 Tax=Pararhodospirillum photometricum DSM 122 TaxID=1150469 RepID=H6SSE8_PARPM|nr:Putative uncharacterized protein [Pararhodospirillum photometricum DSM 122]
MAPYGDRGERPPGDPSGSGLSRGRSAPDPTGIGSARGRPQPAAGQGRNAALGDPGGPGRSASPEPDRSGHDQAGGGGVRFVDPLAVGLDRGRLEVSGALLGRRGDRLRLTLQAFPLDLVSLVAPGLGLEGQVDGTLEGGGSLARPLGTATLVGRALRAGALEGHTLQARLSATLDKTLSADLSLEGLSPTPLQASVTLTPGAGLRFPPSTPIAGSLRWSGDLRALWDLTPWVDHRPAGATTLDLQLAGTLGAPGVTGQVTLERGRYENLLTGTVVENVSLDLDADASRTVRFTLAGTDGGPGSLKANGTFSFSDLAHPVGTAALEATRATLVRRDDVTASLDAVLALALGPQGGHLTGEITTQKVAVRLIDTLGAGVPELEVLEIGGPGGPLTLDDALAAQTAAGPVRAAPLDLDVRVTLPNRVYVTGKGIDTEWKGALHITGTPDQPVVVGAIENLRGQVELLGRNFSLRQSALRFDGGRRLDPNLDIRATNTAGKITAVARITGPVSSPQVSFSSEPSLPQDEVIAHILFGKSSGQLSVIEAVQLARAVGEVGGLATGGSFMDTVRGITGLDVLKLGESEGGATTVQAGAYLRENVYIGVVQGMSLGDSAVEVQVDLTPSLSLETKAGASGAGSAGLLWKRDY